jgi:hypothetical protein
LKGEFPVNATTNMKPAVAAYLAAMGYNPETAVAEAVARHGYVVDDEQGGRRVPASEVMAVRLGSGRQAVLFRGSNQCINAARVDSDGVAHHTSTSVAGNVMGAGRDLLEAVKEYNLERQGWTANERQIFKAQDQTIVWFAK